jgi:hypothetical protein
VPTQIICQFSEGCFTEAGARVVMDAVTKASGRLRYSVALKIEVSMLHAPFDRLRAVATSTLLVMIDLPAPCGRATAQSRSWTRACIPAVAKVR